MDLTTQATPAPGSKLSPIERAAAAVDIPVFASLNGRFLSGRAGGAAGEVLDCAW
jgi:hypothetical protein